MIASFSISRFRYRFTWPHWGMCLLALVGIVFFSSLGVWQIHRASAKKITLAAEAAKARQAPELWLGDNNDVEPFKRVKFAGKFLPQILFLDNQYHAHHIGYHVISPVLMPTGRVILLDRGWVPAGATRQDLPKVDIPQEILDLSGVIYMPSAKTWVLGSGVESQQDNQMVIESFDFDLISQFLHKSVYPFIIRLDKSSPRGYVREWVTVVMPPARHLGYAFQWFALALVVLIVFVALNTGKK
ncbi:MAG: SURF1 family protein [Gammaproteobacteria bacterium]|nr:SURF1 family protein [Gammaproteobacteria bacterium]